MVRWYAREANSAVTFCDLAHMAEAMEEGHPVNRIDQPVPSSVSRMIG